MGGRPCRVVIASRSSRSDGADGEVAFGALRLRCLDSDRKSGDWFPCSSRHIISSPRRRIDIGNRIDILVVATSRAVSARRLHSSGSRSAISVLETDEAHAHCRCDTVRMDCGHGGRPITGLDAVRTLCVSPRSGWSLRRRIVCVATTLSHITKRTYNTWA